MILHIDMDAFYAAVEQLDNPWLKGKCVIVGGTSNRGVVSAASYEARKFGVCSAMPIFQARQKCPQGIFVPPRMQRYREVSQKIMAILCEVTPLVEVVSIDEAYLDISDGKLLHRNPEVVAQAIKKNIKDAVQLNCSIGIAPSKFLAKIASELQKPDGLTLIRLEDVSHFIDSLPIQKVPGVGQKTFEQLQLMGIRTLGDVKKFSEKMLADRLGKYGRRLMLLSTGQDHAAVTPNSLHKSVSSEHTLSADTYDKGLLNKYLLKQSQEVAAQLRKAEVKAKTITLKLKHADFTSVTRSKTITVATQSSKTIFLHAAKLLEAYRMPQKVRLIGVGASGFKPACTPVQLDLFVGVKQREDSWEKLDRTVETIAKKFGRHAIKRASLKNS